MSICLVFVCFRLFCLRFVFEVCIVIFFVCGCVCVCFCLFCVWLCVCCCFMCSGCWLLVVCFCCIVMIYVSPFLMRLMCFLRCCCCVSFFFVSNVAFLLVCVFFAFCETRNSGNGGLRIVDPQSFPTSLSPAKWSYRYACAFPV